VTPAAPDRDCLRCPRLADFRRDNRDRETGWHNAPVPAFGPIEAALLVVGLAPGLKGANRTGRPFTGDGAGNLLYPTLVAAGFAHGDYQARPDDGLRLDNCRVTNAVRCVPPQNKPTGAEIVACNGFLAAEMAAMTGLRVILALGGISHNAVLRTLALRPSAFKFAHGANHDVGHGRLLVDSYHCSRLNTNTGRLTAEMFRAIFDMIGDLLAARPA
jgi:uracil-DNA glycosylase family 4